MRRCMAVDGGVVLTTVTTTAFTTTIRGTTSSCGITSIGAGGAGTECPLTRGVGLNGPSPRGYFFQNNAGMDRNPRNQPLFGMVITMVLRACLFANLIVIGGLIGETALAQQTTPILSLPQLSECKARTHPQLPVKWRAVFLMAPFTNAQLVLAEIVYDGSLP